MPKTMNVSSLTELYSALSKAQGGETILLKDGNYGNFSLMTANRFNLDFPSNVTIKSADAGKPAVFSALDLRDVSNLTLDGVTFDYKYVPGQPIFMKPFGLTGCENITIRNSTFDGDTIKGTTKYDEGLGTGIGLGVRSSSGITVENNEFFGFYRGLVVSGAKGTVVSGNELHNIRMDGMNFSGVNNVRVENNYLHDFARSSNVLEHSDMIQFWTNGTTKPSTDIVIRGNTLDIGEGNPTQSIFMRNDMVDRGFAGKDMFYRNILIEDNVIYNAHSHGISVGETAGLVIRNNSVLHADGIRRDGNDGGVEIPKINVATTSTGVVITGNATGGITGMKGQAGWTVGMNAFVQDQDPTAPGHYNDIFIASSLSGVDGVNEFIALPGGMLDRLKAGAENTAYNKTTDKLDARFHVVQPDDNGAVRIFDAGVTGGQFKALPAGTQFLWDFGDGTTGKGPLVAHKYADGGQYIVKLVVKLPDGKTDVQVSKIGVAGPDVLELSKTGDFLIYDYGVVTTIEAGAAGSANGLQLGGNKVVASVQREHLADLFKKDNFDIAMRLQADTADSSGELFRLHKSFVAYVTGSGELNFILNMADGKTVNLTTKGADLDDRAAHDIRISFDDGKLQLFIDGTLNAATKAAGMMNSAGVANLVFGNPWGGQNFNGDLKTFKIGIDTNDFTPGQAANPKPVPVPVPVPPVDATPPRLQDSLHDDDFSGLILDPSNGSSLKAFKMIGDAHVAQTEHGPAIVLDGNRDHVSLGRVASVEKSDQTAFAIDFAREQVGGGDARLVWNHMKMGLTLSKDGIIVHAATEDEGFKSFTIKKLGLNDTDLHRAVVMIDADSDRLQVVIDDKVVLDERNTDFDFADTDRGWTIGTPWNRFFDGAVTDFRLGDRFEFLDGQRPQMDSLQS